MKWIIYNLEIIKLHQIKEIDLIFKSDFITMEANMDESIQYNQSVQQTLGDQS